METQPQFAPPPQPSGQQPNAGSSNVGMAILAYLGILIIIPFLSDAKNDPFVKFHLKQGVVLIIGYVIALVLSFVPFVGWVISLVCFVLMVIGIINAASGKLNELPVVGRFARNFNF